LPSFLGTVKSQRKHDLQPAGLKHAATQRVVRPQEDVMKSQQQAKYYKRAAEARRLAKETSDPEEKVDLFDVEQRWLVLSPRYP
jgi:hypothetical protein